MNIEINEELNEKNDDIEIISMKMTMRIKKEMKLEENIEDKKE